MRPPAHMRMYHAMGPSPLVAGGLAVRPLPRRPGPLARTPLARPSLTATPAHVGAPAPPASPASCCADAPASLSECPSPGRPVPRRAMQPASARVDPAPAPSASNADTGSDTGGGSTGGDRAWVRGYVVSMGQVNLRVWRVRWRGLSCSPDLGTPNEDIEHDLEKYIMTSDDDLSLYPVTYRCVHLRLHVHHLCVFTYRCVHPLPSSPPLPPHHHHAASTWRPEQTHLVQVQMRRRCWRRGR